MKWGELSCRNWVHDGGGTTFTLSAFMAHWSSDPGVLLYVEWMPRTVACWPYLYYSLNCLSEYCWARGTCKSKPVAVAVLCRICRLTEGSAFWSSFSSMSSSRFSSWKLISCYSEVSVGCLCSTLHLSSLSCSAFNHVINIKLFCVHLIHHSLCISGPFEAHKSRV